MSMYECDQCGSEESCHPQVIIALNSPINYWENFGYDTDNFDKKWYEFYNKYCEENNLEKQAYNSKAIEYAWKEFWAFIGRVNHADFCSIKCAVEYLQQKQFEHAEILKQPVGRC